MVTVAKEAEMEVVVQVVLLVHDEIECALHAHGALVLAVALACALHDLLAVVLAPSSNKCM
jgi:hypothetical protein